MPDSVQQRFRYEGDPTKGSRFIVTIGPTPSEEAARTLLAEVAAEMPDASHHCWAWRIARPSIDRCSDDGEPGGSAGKPILAQLTGHDLVDTAVIVTRYFGGTKLGVGGLVRAYGGAAGEALDRSRTSPWVELTTVDFNHPYGDGDEIERVIAQADGRILTSDYGAEVRRSVELPVQQFDDFAQAIANATAGRIRLSLDPE